LKKLLNFLARNNIYLLIIALGLFATAFLLNKYVIRNTSINLYTRLIERDIIQKEKDFQKLASDTALIRSLVDQTYSEETLNKLLDQNKGYQIFVYEKTFASQPWLRFWNTQVVIPPMNLLDETDVEVLLGLGLGLIRRILEHRIDGAGNLLRTAAIAELENEEILAALDAELV